MQNYVENVIDVKDLSPVGAGRTFFKKILVNIERNKKYILEIRNALIL